MHFVITYVGASLKFRERSLDVYENKGQVMIELVVSVPTPEDFTVNVYSVGIRSRRELCTYVDICYCLSIYMAKI